MKIAALTISFLLFVHLSSMGQVLDESYETLLLEEEDNTAGLAFKPVIGVGIGSLSFFGDVTDYFGNPLNGLTSGRVSIGRNLGNHFDIEFHGTFGSVSGNEYGGNFDESLNFHTNIFLGGVSVAYNFNHWLKRKRPIHPYISLGIEMLQFSPKGDLIDVAGNEYHYWQDGT